MHPISIQELGNWQANCIDFVLLDVREDFEREHFSIGGIHIPLAELCNNLELLPFNKPIVVYCAKGIRSAIAIQKLELRGYSKLYNLSGGIYALQNMPH
jgi:adenylyltransferase/sulfurtransferase